MTESIDLNSLLPRPKALEERQIKKEKKEVPTLISDFSKALKNTLKSVNDLAKESDLLTEKLVTGEVDNIHDVMIAATKAGIALELTTQIRNQVIRAYQEMMRMR